MNRYAAKLLDIKEIFRDDPENFDLSRIQSAIDMVTNFAFGFAGSVALIFLLWGGILYLTAGGSTEQVTRAKGTITWALIGLLVVISAYAIVKYFARNVITNSPI